MRDVMWTFQTKNFRIVASIEPPAYVDVSWDETGETATKIDSGEWQAFDTVVTVYHRGRELGSDSLCQSIYANPAEFFSEHRDPDPMNRNCSAMRTARGSNTCIGHYFPDMVRNAVKEARTAIEQLKSVQVRA